MSALIHQASCVALGARAVLIEGAPSSGKSSLALVLIDRGAALIGDDGVTLERRGDVLWASPPPNIAGRLEIRNVGIIDLPTEQAPVALVLRLDPMAPRHVEEAETIVLAGVPLPLIRLWPDSPALPLRAEWALKLHGLS
ncbi:serine kinase [Altererythrobacter sp. CC-YST694]|uniref:HPr kinase/phosphorylase n=1 Tax=Altererythrobacter sp. CC-YST694 TaxID=2755038 RepID=UPI001D005787|nr:HPr kinase/phosphatase C-terminal domain-containing protein [Altererythrobacter sp. CC-YST694]MCB5424881.1 serine kinase [Altererythrobacter sp. CC-YST694]